MERNPTGNRITPHTGAKRILDRQIKYTQWRDRPYQEQSKIRDFPCTMDQDIRNNRQQLQRNYPGTEEEEDYYQNRSIPSRSTTTEKTKHLRRFKRTLTHNIINLSRHQLTPGEISLLSKGLNFIPRQIKNTKANLYWIFYYLIEN